MTPMTVAKAFRSIPSATTLLAVTVLALSGTALGKTIMLTGEVNGADHQTYRAVTFDVPPGTQRLRIAFEHDGRDLRTVVDLGIYGPNGFRGASGSNKAVVELGPSDATPSYRPGPIESGQWRLMLGFPNVRGATFLPNGVKRVTRFKATITLFSDGDEIPESAYLNGAVRLAQSWYRGDLHSHSAHSDGSCASKSNRRVPCPVHLTVDAARAEGLDFIAVTDHNTTSHFQTLRELQPYYDDILLIPGVELTSFKGHANVFGIEEIPDFFLPGGGDAKLPKVFRTARARGGLVAINHPGLPSGEECMGCGWKAETDWRDVDAIEVVNGGSLQQFASAEGPFSAIRFWDRLLDAGYEVMGIASSDSHDPLANFERQVPVGRPRTVVEARSLSQRAIFDAIRNGRSFVDVDGSRDRKIDFIAVRGVARAQMGSHLVSADSSPIDLLITTFGVAGNSLIVVRSGGIRTTLGTIADSGVMSTTITLPAAVKRDWIRLEVRDTQDRLLLLSNPVFISR